MRYRDVAAAVDWLCSRLGFRLHSSVSSDDGEVVYAQVAFGNAMVMLAPIQDTALDRFMRQPDEIGGAETQSCYFYVADAAAHFAQARTAGAEIILDLQPYDSGGEGYSCRDPEGHIWTFGSFDPWGRDGGGPVQGRDRPAQRPRRLARALVGLACVGASGAAAAWMSGADIAGVVRGGGAVHGGSRQAATVAVVRETDVEAARVIEARLTVEKSAREAAEQVAREAADALARERGLRDASLRDMEALRTRVSAEAAARASAEAALIGVNAQVDRERAGRELAERNVEAAAAMAAEHQAARLAAEAAAREARAEADRQRSAQDASVRDGQPDMQRLAAERSEREAAELGLRQARDELLRERNAREAAEREVQEAGRRAEAAETANAAAEASASQLRADLAAEQAAKKSAWGAIVQLRKQVSQVQKSAKGKASGDAVADADTVAPAPQPVRKQPPQRKRKTTQAPAED